MCKSGQQEMMEIHNSWSNPPSGGSNVKKECEHIYRYLGRRTLKPDNGVKYGEEVDVFYCEKCLDYQHK